MCNFINKHTHTLRKEMVGSVAANPDNLESNKEAGGGAQHTQGSSKSLKKNLNAPRPSEQELYKWRECVPSIAPDQRFS